MLRAQLLCFSLYVYLHLAIGGDDRASLLTAREGGLCSCKVSCMDQKSPSTPLIQEPPSPFYFDSGLNACVELPSLCQVDAGCTFTAQSACESSCVARAKGRGDKKSKEDHKAHSHGNMDKAEVPNRKFPSSSSRNSLSHGVRWDLVVGGTCVMVVLVAALTVVGVVTYNHRVKKKERMRSRYIRDVMEMYDSTSSDSSLSESEETRPHKATTSSQPFIQL